MATYDDFLKIDIRVGQVVQVDDFPEAHKPAYKLTIDFGPEIGTKMSSGQFVGAYPEKRDLIGKLVLGVVNLTPKKVGPFVSETLTLGVSDGKGSWILVSPERQVGPGLKMQ